MAIPAATLNELIEITRDGQTFYAEAIARVRNPHLKSVFRALLDVKSRMISTLSEHVRARGIQPSSQGTIAGGFHRLYGEVRAALSSQGDTTFVAQLEAAEGRLLNAFEQAADGSDDAELRRTISQHLPRIRLCHEEMQNLKASLAA